MLPKLDFTQVHVLLLITVGGGIGVQYDGNDAIAHQSAVNKSKSMPFAPIHP